MMRERTKIFFNPDSGLGKGREVMQKITASNPGSFEIVGFPNIPDNQGGFTNQAVVIIGGDGTYAGVLKWLANFSESEKDESRKDKEISVYLIPAGQESVMAKSLGSFEADGVPKEEDIDFIPLTFREVGGDKFVWSVELGCGAEPLGMSVLGFIEVLRKIPVLKRVNKYVASVAGAAKFFLNCLRGKTKPFDFRIEFNYGKGFSGFLEKTALALIAINDPFLRWGRVDFSSHKITDDGDLILVWEFAGKSKSRLGIAVSALLGLLQMGASQVRGELVKFPYALSVLYPYTINKEAVFKIREGNYPLFYMLDSEYHLQEDGTMEITAKNEIRNIKIARIKKEKDL